MSGQDVKKYDLSKFYKFSLQDVNDIEAFLTVGSFFFVWTLLLHSILPRDVGVCDT